MQKPTLPPLLSCAGSSYTSHVPRTHTSRLRKHEGGAFPFKLGPTCSGQTGLETQVKGGRQKGILAEPAEELGSSFLDAGDPLPLSRWKVRGCHGSTQ